MKHDTNTTSRGIIVFDNNTLMVQYFPEYGTYITLGGHVKEGESLWDGLVRELKEESGLIVTAKPRKPDFKYQNNYYFILNNDDLDPNTGEIPTQTDGGEVEIIDIEEFFTTNSEHKDDFKIKPCMTAVSRALEKMK